MKKIAIVLLLSCGVAFVNASNIEEFEEFNHDNYKAMAWALPNPKKFEYAEVTGLSFRKEHKAKRKFLAANLCKKIDDIDPIGPNKGAIFMPPLLSLSEISEISGTHFTYIDPIGPNKGVVSMPPLLSVHYIFN